MKENPVAYFDMDGTLADYDKAMNASLDKLRGPKEKPSSHWTRDNEPPHIKARKKLIKSHGDWWENLPRFQLGWDVLEVAQALGFRIVILTQGPRRIPVAWSHKVSWCMNQLPDDTDITITRDKGLSYGRVLVDDFPEYVEQWLEWRPRGIVIMPAHSYNAWYSHPNVVRYDGTNIEEVNERLSWARNREDGKGL